MIQIPRVQAVQNTLVQIFQVRRQLGQSTMEFPKSVTVCQPGKQRSDDKMNP